MYYSIWEMLEMIDRPNRTALKKLFAENEKLFKTVRGSTHNHQAWRGGYWDHVQETMNIGVEEYERWIAKRCLGFTQSSLLLVLSVHDVEKPWSYVLDESGEAIRKPELASKAAQREFRNKKLEEYGIVLTLKEENAMQYVEGEGSDYTNRKRVMNELAALCHICDVFSARVFPTRPMEKNESWGGRQFERKIKTSR